MSRAHARAAQRFNLMATSSYAALDAGWQAALASLHDDYFFRRQARRPRGPRGPNPKPALRAAHSDTPDTPARRCEQHAGVFPCLANLQAGLAVAAGPWRKRGGGAVGRQDALWRAHALKSLPALMRATRMLVCGEDLGMIPACVHPVMAQLGLVGARLLAARRSHAASMCLQSPAVSEGPVCSPSASSHLLMKMFCVPAPRSWTCDEMPRPAPASWGCLCEGTVQLQAVRCSQARQRRSGVLSQYRGPQAVCATRAGLRIQRMPSEAGQEFGDPAAYPYMTVASPSCHDTSTTRAWWEQDAGRRERFYDQARLSDGVGPADLRVKWWCYGR